MHVISFLSFFLSFYLSIYSSCQPASQMKQQRRGACSGEMGKIARALLSSLNLLNAGNCIRIEIAFPSSGDEDYVRKKVTL